MANVGHAMLLLFKAFSLSGRAFTHVYLANTFIQTDPAMIHVTPGSNQLLYTTSPSAISPAQTPKLFIMTVTVWISTAHILYN